LKAGGFAKRKTTGPCRNGYHCLNAATVLIAVLGRAVRASTIGHALRLFEFAQHVRENTGERANSDCPVDINIDAISDSIPTSRHVRFAFHVQRGSR